MASRAIVAGCLVATLAFAAYTRTLLPGVDLGDTGGFQAAVLWPEISARQAYPLYYNLARPFVAAVAPENPARGLNLFSALCAALATGFLAAVVTLVTSSAMGGAASGLFLAFSFTFWTQAVIAEVYALHLAIVGICLVALALWWRKPTTGRLALFFAAYAVGFGNHLSMILLLVPFAVFLLAATDDRKKLLRPRIAVLAAGIAAVAALQYLPHLAVIWTSIGAPEGWTSRLAAFWFDVTKSDWRESMVLGVSPDQFGERVAMFGFDARQQFGVVGLALAAVGWAALWTMSRAWAGLVALAYAINTAFAFTYNVGDPHAFFLPGHYFTAFAAGAAVAMAMRAPRPIAAVAAAAIMAFAGWRAYDTWPSADRHRDHRAERLVAALAMGLDERRELFVTHLNWQVENALLYETRHTIRHVVWTRLPEVMLRLPLLVSGNHAGGRDVVLNAAGAGEVAAAFDGLFPLVPDPVPPAIPLAGQAARLPRGAAYVLTILPPTRDERIDEDDLADALITLTGGRVTRRRNEPYEVLIGRVGDAPLHHRSSARPFRERLSLPEGTLDIRFEGWLGFETFRRAGFGHVLLDREPILTVERGVSLAVPGRQPPVYAFGLYAVQPRFRIPAGGIPELALLH